MFAGLAVGASADGDALGGVEEPDQLV